MTLSEYADECRKEALLSYCISYPATEHWSEEIFDNDFSNGIAPEEAIKRYLPGG